MTEWITLNGGWIMSNTSGIISEKDVLQIGDSKAVLSADKNNTSVML